jgi:hypothetical protein
LSDAQTQWKGDEKHNRSRGHVGSRVSKRTAPLGDYITLIHEDSFSAKTNVEL